MRRLTGPVVVVAVTAAAMASGHAQTIPGRPLPRPVQTIRPATTVGAVVGEVVDSTTGRGVGGALVTIRSTTGGPADRRRADALGRFYFMGLYGGDYVLTATRHGYLEGAAGRLRPDGDAVPVPVTGGRVTGTTRIEVWRPGALEGRVVDEANDPVAAARVWAYRRAIEGGRVAYVAAASTFTDDRGMFRFSGLLPSDYLVAFVRQRILMPLSVARTIETTGSASGAASVLGSLMGPPSALAGSLDPPPDATHLELGVPPPSTPLAASGRPRDYPTTYYPGGETAQTAQLLSIEAGREYAGVLLQIRAVDTGRLDGDVVGDDGPVAGVVVRLLGDGETDAMLGLERGVTMTDDAGEFSFGDVPVGRYVVDVRGAPALVQSMPDTHLSAILRAPAGPAGLRLPNLDAVSQLWGRRPVQVSAETTEPAIVLVSAGETITGEILFEGRAERPPAGVVSSITVWLDPDDSGAPRPARGAVDAQGRFDISGVMPGRYAVRVTGMPPGWPLASARSGAIDLLERSIEIGGRPPAAIVIRAATDLGRVEGTVLDTRGRPATSASVVVFPIRAGEGGRSSAFRLRSTRVSATGRYLIDGLPDGAYGVAVIDEAGARDWQDPARLSVLRARARPVTVRARETRPVELRYDGRE